MDTVLTCLRVIAFAGGGALLFLAFALTESERTKLQATFDTWWIVVDAAGNSLRRFLRTVFQRALGTVRSCVSKVIGPWAFDPIPLARRANVALASAGVTFAAMRVLAGDLAAAAGFGTFALIGALGVWRLAAYRESPGRLISFGTFTFLVTPLLLVSIVVIARGGRADAAPRTIIATPMLILIATSIFALLSSVTAGASLLVRDRPRFIRGLAMLAVVPVSYALMVVLIRANLDADVSDMGLIWLASNMAALLLWLSIIAMTIGGVVCAILSRVASRAVLLLNIHQVASRTTLLRIVALAVFAAAGWGVVGRLLSFVT